MDALHLSSFGLMDTTLEEVFLKVSEEDQSLESSEAGERPRPLPGPRPAPPPPLELGPELLLLFPCLEARGSGWEQGPGLPRVCWGWGSWVGGHAREGLEMASGPKPPPPSVLQT